MNTVAVFGSGHVVEAVVDVAAFLSALAQKGERVLLEETFFSELTQHPGTRSYLDQIERFAGGTPGEIDYIICFGGDGTFLRTLHRIASPTTPILAINSGHLGFLTDLDIHDAAQYIDRLILRRLPYRGTEIALSRSRGIPSLCPQRDCDTKKRNRVDHQRRDPYQRPFLGRLCSRRTHCCNPYGLHGLFAQLEWPSRLSGLPRAAHHPHCAPQPKYAPNCTTRHRNPTPQGFLSQ